MTTPDVSHFPLAPPPPVWSNLRGREANTELGNDVDKPRTRKIVTRTQSGGVRVIYEIGDDDDPKYETEEGDEVVQDDFETYTIVKTGETLRDI